MKKTLLLVMLAFSGTVLAETYVDIGLGIADSSYGYDVSISCQYDAWYAYCSANAEPFRGVVGTVEAGYTKNGFTVYASHTSIINEKDSKGLNILGIKKRIRLFE